MGGYAETGVTIMQMDVGLDTGDMSISSPARLLQKIPVVRCTTSGRAWPTRAYHHVETIGRRHAKPEVQDETLVTYAEKLSKEKRVLTGHFRQHSLNAAFALSSMANELAGN